VTTIPVEIAREVANIGDEFVEAEAVILNALRESGPSLEVLRAARAESQHRIQQLASASLVLIPSAAGLAPQPDLIHESGNKKTAGCYLLSAAGGLLAQGGPSTVT